jgi:hypothetical protein
MTRTRDEKGEMERIQWKRLGIRDKSTETEGQERIPRNLART